MTRMRSRLVLLAIFLLALMAGSSCAGPGYYLQAAGGHLKLMSARERVSDLLADPATDPQLATRLRAAADMLGFAESALALKADDSYSSFVETGRQAVVWNVIAAPEFSLDARRWCFPVAGCVPYRGYFDEQAARRFAGRLQRKGFDVSLQAVSAYSTLGWFSDPLLDTMLRGADANLASTLFHELAHRTLYVKGDSMFSESYASFVGDAGTRAWLQSRGEQGALVDWTARRAALQRFRKLQSDARRQLQRLYATDMPPAAMRVEKQAIFDWMDQQYRNLVTLEWGGRDWFGGWMQDNRNNAALALDADYQQGVCAFESLFESADGDFGGFHRLAARRAALPEPERRQWLWQPCDDAGGGVAYAGEL